MTTALIQTSGVALSAASPARAASRSARSRQYWTSSEAGTRSTSLASVRTMSRAYGRVEGWRRLPAIRSSLAEQADQVRDGDCWIRWAKQESRGSDHASRRRRDAGVPGASGPWKSDTSTRASGESSAPAKTTNLGPRFGRLRAKRAPGHLAPGHSLAARNKIIAPAGAAPH
jgi:hypothetical protein